jgi:hypothetical protein
MVALGEAFNLDRSFPFGYGDTFNEMVLGVKHIDAVLIGWLSCGSPGNVGAARVA